MADRVEGPGSDGWSSVETEEQGVSHGGGLESDGGSSGELCDDRQGEGAQGTDGIGGHRQRCGMEGGEACFPVLGGLNCHIKEEDCDALGVKCGLPAKERMCVRCRMVKSASAFHRCSKDRTGLRSWCKACRAEYKKEQKGEQDAQPSLQDGPGPLMQLMARSQTKRSVQSWPAIVPVATPVSGQVLPDGHKRCSKCTVMKPVDCFTRDASQRSGYKSQCKECRSTSKKRPPAEGGTEAPQDEAEEANGEHGAVGELAEADSDRRVAVSDDSGDDCSSSSSESSENGAKDPSAFFSHLFASVRKEMRRKAVQHAAPKVEKSEPAASPLTPPAMETVLGAPSTAGKQSSLAHSISPGSCAQGILVPPTMDSLGGVRQIANGVAPASGNGVQYVAVPPRLKKRSLERDQSGQLVKYCSGCKAMQPAATFRKDSSKSSGLRSRCRECEGGQASHDQLLLGQAPAQTYDPPLPALDKPKAPVHGEETWHEKSCTRCGEVKSAPDFCRDRSKPSGLSSWCKACTSRRNIKPWGTKARTRAQVKVGTGASLKRAMKFTADVPAAKAARKGASSIAANSTSFDGAIANPDQPQAPWQGTVAPTGALVPPKGSNRIRHCEAEGGSGGLLRRSRVPSSEFEPEAANNGAVPWDGRPSARAREVVKMEPACWPLSAQKCRKCEVEKPAGEFYPNKQIPSGLFAWCKKCCEGVNFEVKPRVPRRRCRRCGKLTRAESFIKDLRFPNRLRVVCSQCVRRGARPATDRSGSEALGGGRRSCRERARRKRRRSEAWWDEWKWVVLDWPGVGEDADPGLVEGLWVGSGETSSEEGKRQRTEGLGSTLGNGKIPPYSRRVRGAVQAPHPAVAQGSEITVNAAADNGPKGPRMNSSVLGRRSQDIAKRGKVRDAELADKSEACMPDREARSVSEKCCMNCGTLKSADAFHRNKTSRTGLASWCIDCKRRGAQALAKGLAAGRQELGRRQSKGNRSTGAVRIGCEGQTPTTTGRLCEADDEGQGSGATSSSGRVVGRAGEAPRCEGGAKLGVDGWGGMAEQCGQDVRRQGAANSQKSCNEVQPRSGRRESIPVEQQPQPSVSVDHKDGKDGRAPGSAGAISPAALRRGSGSSVLSAAVEQHVGPEEGPTIGRGWGGLAGEGEGCGRCVPRPNLERGHLKVGCGGEGVTDRSGI
eukprot:evm.model.scf_386.1 EVM.evm.TU.scf_386.1   scf_386:1048-4963(+)